MNLAGVDLAGLNRAVVNRGGRFVVTAVAIAVMASLGQAQELHTTPSDTATQFAPFQQWMGAVLTGDATALKALYSTDPAVQVSLNRITHPADFDTGFWLGLKARSMKVEIIRQIVRPGLASVIFKADVVTGTPEGKTISITDDQYWRKQGDQLRLLGVERTDAPQLKQPSDMKKNIYPADTDVRAEINEAEAKAARGHNRLLLVFGANWCFDCHVLDLAFERPDLAPVLVANYEVVHVDLGPDGKKNADVVKEFGAVLDQGIPTLAVAESDGRVVVSQKDGEFEDARGLTPEVVLAFLNQWKPTAK